MAELESVMQKLSDHTARLRRSAVAGSGAGAEEDRALMIEQLALVSEALLRVGRDVRLMKTQWQDRP